MTPLTTDMKIVCICRRGQVRSVAARHVLYCLGFRKVLVCGWENNDQQAVDMLCEWADAVLVVGRATEWADVPGPPHEHKVRRVDIGYDAWGRYDHPNLLSTLTPLIEAML